MAMRKKHEPPIRAKVALEALKGEKTIAELSSEYGIHSTQIRQWKQELIERAAELFARPGNAMARQQEDITDKLHKTIGELTVENKWLKKKLQILD